jgi:adenosylcobyric acid synthase
MARNLMIQGTMSGAGKSILTAGILRVPPQDGDRKSGG